MSETEILVEEFAPPHMSKKEFARLVVNTTAEGYDFLTINMKMGWEKRFRHNLGQLIPLPPLFDINYEPNSKDNGITLRIHNEALKTTTGRGHLTARLSKTSYWVMKPLI